MPRLLPVFGVLFLLLFSTCELPSLGNATEDEAANLRFDPIPLIYPQPFRDTSVRDTFGQKIVADPFRWMESDKDPGLKTWIRDQRVLCDTYFSQLPFRSAIKERLAAFTAYEHWGIPEKHGDYYYLWYQADALQHGGLYRMASIKDSLELVLNRFHIQLTAGDEFSAFSYAPNGQFLALEIANPQNAARRIRVWDLFAGKLLPDQISGVQFSRIAWSGKGFFYSRYPSQRTLEDNNQQALFHQLFYHRLGTDQPEDELVYADRRHPRRRVQAEMDDSGHWLILSVSETEKGNALFFRDMRDEDPSFIPIVESLTSEFTFIGSVGQTLIIKTTDKAPRGKVIRISTQRPEPAYWEEVIPQHADVLHAVQKVNSHWIAHYLHRGSSQLRLLDRDAQEVRRLSLPGLGTITGIKAGDIPHELFYGFSSVTQPETIYRLQLDDYATSIFRKPPLPLYAAAFTTKQLTYESYDGTQIPLYIIHKKGITLNAEHPVLLLASKGDRRMMSPSWNLTGLHLMAAFLENGGICAIPSIRGGGALGERWVQAGRLDRQQQQFDDFQAAAEYLITNRYTKREKLAIYGEENGGLVVGACLTQRPDLFRVAIMKNAVLDMLRYTHYKNGWQLRPAYGTTEDSLYRDVLLSYSPLHNLEPLAYPATMLTIDGSEKLVASVHSYKFTAALQNAQTGAAPVVLWQAGSGNSVHNDQSREAVDVLSFLLYNLKESWTVN